MAPRDFYFGRLLGDLLIFYENFLHPQSHFTHHPMIFIKSIKGKVSSIDKNG
jgi:hypothetical protein